MPKSGRFLAARFFLLSPLLLLGACVSMPTMQDYAPISSAPAPAKPGAPRAAVALTDNQSPTPTEKEMNEKLKDVRKAHAKFLIPEGPDVFAVSNLCNAKDSPIGPERLTEILIKELSASGSFASVDHEGAGPADVLVKPTIKTCTWSVMGYNVHNVWDFEIEVQALKGEKTVMTKSYARRWEKWNGDFKQVYGRLFPPLMQEIRNDIVKSLGG